MSLWFSVQRHHDVLVQIHRTQTFDFRLALKHHDTSGGNTSKNVVNGIKVGI